MFKVGDKVRIRNDLEVNKNYTNRVNPSDNVSFEKEMEEYKGKEATIVDVDHDGDYYLDIDDTDWIWCDEMLEAIKDKQETNIEHMLNFLEEYSFNRGYCDYEFNEVVLKFSVPPTLPLFFRCEDFESWAREPYKSIKLSQFEYDCLSCCDEDQRKKKFNHYDLCMKMKKKGYYKNVDVKMTVEEILERCEIVNEKI